MTNESKPRDARALNAYRHGLTGQVLVLTPADQVAYDAHCRGIHESLSPSGALETDLAQSVADDRWRLKRAVALEGAIFALGLNAPDVVTADNSEIHDAFAQARVWLAEGKNLQLLSLYEHRIQRHVEKNLQLLRQMQQDRQTALDKTLEEARLLSQLAQSKGESFDPDRDFPREALPPQFDFSSRRISRLVTHNCRLAEAGKRYDAPPRSLRRAA